MTLPRQVVTEGMIAEYRALADLVRSLSEEQWEQPTRCEGWRVADVAAHVSGILDDVVSFRLEGIGTPEAVERQVADRKGSTPAQLAEELDRNTKLARDIAAGFDDQAWDGPSPAGLAHTLGFGVEGLWYDTYVHTDDIRAAVGQPPERDPQSLQACVSHVAQLLTDQGWGPATLAFHDLDEHTVSGGGGRGRRITGDALDFVLAATGRGEPEPLGLDGTVNVYR